MNKEWLITDTHFDHYNIGVYCDRPDGWQDRIIRNWKRIVKPEDTVVHLGDVQVGKKQPLKELLDSLPGTKVLVMGNHDTQSALWYMRNGFAFACQAMAYKQVTLTHHPSTSLISGTDINIHGHVHNSPWEPMPGKPWQRLLAIEYVNYEPVDFDKFVGLCRSERKWEEFKKKWKVPEVKGRKKEPVVFLAD